VRRLFRNGSELAKAPKDQEQTEIDRNRKREAGCAPLKRRALIGR
jgi:hypothetical protein